MKRPRASIVFVAMTAAVLSVGCVTPSILRPPRTPGSVENAPAYGYHPIDPLPVLIKVADGEPPPPVSKLLSVLPDETMRIAIGEVQRSGNVSYGPAKTGVAGNSYVVVLDYIKFHTQSFEVEITDTGLERSLTSLSAYYWLMRDQQLRDLKPPASVKTTTAKKSIVPVYVGVGLRLTATVTVNKGAIDLGNLFALGLAAQTNRITGTMVVQTLGISGQNISSLIPMPGEINPTTIQNAILALGAIKAKLYDSGTEITPRVVGVYNTLGGGPDRVNSFISTLLSNPPTLPLSPPLPPPPLPVPAPNPGGAG
jgi:hypothetical protein